MKYVIEKEGVYSHGLFNFYNEEEQAKADCCRYALHDVDSHHVWSVKVWEQTPFNLATEDADLEQVYRTRRAEVIKKIVDIEDLPGKVVGSTKGELHTIKALCAFSEMLTDKREGVLHVGSIHSVNGMLVLGMLEDYLRKGEGLCKKQRPLFWP